MREALPPPDDPRAAPRVLLAALRRLVGEPAAAGYCVDLLDGADPHTYADVLAYLGGHLDWDPYWVRAWGARGLLYVWADSAGPSVVQGLHDPAWRVAENCLKVATVHELSAAGPAAVELAGHPLPRVRAQAVRTIGVVGDTEHVAVVEAAFDDPDVGVRGAADRAMTRLVQRLDLPT